MTTATSQGDQPTGRAFLALGFLITTIVTTGATVTGNYYLSNWQVVRTQKVADTNKFIDATISFNALVRDYMGKVDAGEKATKLKDDIGKNVQLQDSLLESQSPYLDARGRDDVRRYRG